MRARPRRQGHLCGLRLLTTLGGQHDTWAITDTQESVGKTGEKDSLL